MDETHAAKLVVAMGEGLIPPAKAWDVEIVTRCFFAGTDENGSQQVVHLNLNHQCAWDVLESDDMDRTSANFMRDYACSF
jgi:hypothetical protein